MNKRALSTLPGLIIAVAILIFGGQEIWKVTPKADINAQIDESHAYVARVVDGDTFELVNGQKVRMIGINTPESVDPRKPVEYFGKEASAYTKSLLEKRYVVMKKDVSNTDRYGRLLRYVYLGDGTFVNEKLVRDGYAQIDTFPPDVKYADLFKTAEQDARTNKRGMWK